MWPFKQIYTCSIIQYSIKPAAIAEAKAESIFKLWTMWPYRLSWIRSVAHFESNYCSYYSSDVKDARARLHPERLQLQL